MKDYPPGYPRRNSERNNLNEVAGRIRARVGYAVLIAGRNNSNLASAAVRRKDEWELFEQSSSHFVYTIFSIIISSSFGIGIFVKNIINAL